MFHLEDQNDKAFERDGGKGIITVEGKGRSTKYSNKIKLAYL